MGIKPPGRLEKALTALGVPHDVKVYPAAGHRFTSRKPAALAPLAALARLNYDKEAAEDAWQRIFAFFGRYLRDEIGQADLESGSLPGVFRRLVPTRRGEPLSVASRARLNTS